MEKKVCPNCHIEMMHGAKMCPKCGYSAELMDTEPEDKFSLKKELLYIFHKHFFLILVFIGFLIFAGYRAYQNFDHKKYALTPVSELVRKPNTLHDINSLYISDGRNYRYLLNKKEKNLYEKLIAAIKQFEPTITFNFKDYGYDSKWQTTKGISKINHAIIMDHPELFQYGYIGYQINEGNHQVTLTITYATEKDRYEQNLSLIETALKEVKEKTKLMSEYEKAKYVYEYLLKNNHYGTPSDSRAQSAFSAFSPDQSPVCAGFARASQLLFQSVGLTSTIVTGSVRNVLHEWNMVQISGEYYYFDATRASEITLNHSLDGYVLHNGFLFSDYDNYEIEEAKMIPKTKGEQFLYYPLEKKQYRYTGIEDLKAKLASYQEETIELQITNMATLYEQKELIKMELGVKDIILSGSVAFFRK